jgi:hypothetical protein
MGSFAGIDWSTGINYIKIEMDPKGGSDFRLEDPAHQLLSVPYALFAENVTSITETDPVYTGSQAAGITATDIVNLGNLSGINTGDQDLSSLATQNALEDMASAIRADIPDVSGLAAKANVLELNNTTPFTPDADYEPATKAYVDSRTVESYTETDPTVKAINGIVKSNGTNISAATAGTDYLTPTGSAASLTNFPILNQNTTGSAASFTGSLAGQVTGKQGATVVGNSAVIGKVLTGYTSGAGIVAATDNILQAIQKLNGNNPPHYIGEDYGGGIVFYVYDNGRHGLIAATADQSTGIRWYGGSYTNTRARADGVGAGLKNTAIIIANQGPVDGNEFAATVCNEYSVTVDGVTYGDWYLPSKYELNLLYLQKTVVGGFAGISYWSSTEISNNGAWYQYFSSGYQNYNYKDAAYYVRAVRDF